MPDKALGNADTQGSAQALGQAVREATFDLPVQSHDDLAQRGVVLRTRSAAIGAGWQGFEIKTARGCNRASPDFPYLVRSCPRFG